MSSPLTARQAGIAAIVAASLLLVSQVTQLVFPLLFPESFWIATQSLRMGLALAAMFALLVALTGFHARQADATGRFGLIAYVAASLGTLLVAGDWWYEAFIGPVLRAEAPDLLATAPSGSILIAAALTSGTFAAGWVLFGLASLRAGVLPRRPAVLLSVAGVAGILTLIPPFQIPLAVAVGWLGLWLITADGRQGQPAGTPRGVPVAPVRP